MKEVERISEFLADYMPLINEKLLPQAYNIQLDAYKLSLQEIQGNVGDFMLSMDLDGTILFVNNASNLYFGKSPGEMQGKNLRTISPNVYETIVDILHKEDNPDHQSVEISTPSGRSRVLEIHAWRSGITLFQNIICIGTDVTWIRDMSNPS